MAAITCTNVDFVSSTSGTTMSRFLTGWAAAGHLCVLAIVHQQAAASVADIASITGGPTTTLTKLAAVAFNTHAAPVHKTEIWYGLTQAGTGTVTINFSSAVNSARCQFIEFVNVDQSKGTSGIMQTATQFSDTATTTPGVVMGTYANSQNAGFCLLGCPGIQSMTPKTGWTEIAEGQISSGSGQELHVQFKSAGDTTPIATVASGSVVYGGIALELASFGLTQMAGKAATATSAKQGLVQRFR